MMHQQRDRTRLCKVRCQRGRAGLGKALASSRTDGQTDRASLGLGGVAQVLLARRELLGEDSFGEELLGFLVR